MRFIEFFVKNFKGIEELNFKLDKSINANVFTLVGLNESGKTTILEAINLFDSSSKMLGVLEDVPGSIIKDFNTIIPISKRDNFTGDITITANLKVDDHEFEKISEYALKNTRFKELSRFNTLIFTRLFKYENSKYMYSTNGWTVLTGKIKDPKTIKQKTTPISLFTKGYEEDHAKIYNFCRDLIPNIIYFPNFLFDFPAKVYLESSESFSAKDKFYVKLVQNILDSLENNTNIPIHLVNRFNSEDKNDKRNLNALLQKMSNKVTEVIFTAWNQIFNKDIKDTKVIVEAFKDEEKGIHLELSIQSVEGIYLINERSLGFRWFFTFLLFTQFKPLTQEKNKDILFLFDEPASNLHSNAQTQLLKSFANLTVNSKIIYTTHSHHLINPNWLESTFVVTNSGISLDPSSENLKKKTHISIKPYKEFVVNHPHNTAYFQPILDVLDYAPSNLEMIPKCAFFEGKNDYYVLKYFNDIILDQPLQINIAPSTGAGNLDTLISLYTGWGKEFMIILDSDDEGKKQKERYIEGFGLAIEEYIFSLEDIDSNWAGVALEKLFDKDELLNFQKNSFSTSDKYNKKTFNRAIQESLINKVKFTFSSKTIGNIRKILNFIDNRFNVPFQH